MHDTFVHLHVASGYSLQYGASTPAALVERAAAWGQPALALTDRDGLYGAVRFVQACEAAGVAPILGVDLAVHVTAPARRSGGRDRGGPGMWDGSAGLTGLTGTTGLTGAGGSGWGRRAGGAVPPPAARTPAGSRVRETGRTPTRGGAAVDARLPRVTVLARGRRLGLDPGAGWGRLCRLVTRTHLAGGRGSR